MEDAETDTSFYPNSWILRVLGQGMMDLGFNPVLHQLKDFERISPISQQNVLITGPWTRTEQKQHLPLLLKLLHWTAKNDHCMKYVGCQRAQVRGILVLWFSDGSGAGSCSLLGGPKILMHFVCMSHWIKWTAGWLTNLKPGPLIHWGITTLFIELLD